MKTKDLIKLLQEEDPTGEAIVIGADGEVNTAIGLPWYYDGKPGIMMRDSDNKVIGYQQIDESFTAGKIYLYGFGEFEAGEYWSEHEDFIVKGPPEFIEKVRKQKIVNEEIRDKVKQKPVPVLKTCPACGGDGITEIQSGPYFRECEKCKGVGQVSQN